MSDSKINPYYFVPLKQGPDRTTGYPDRYRLQPEYISGRLVCELEALSPLISLDQRYVKSHNQLDKCGNFTGEKIKVFKFLRNSRGQVILQGASLKGMIRSVYEAITDSCLPLVNVPTNIYKDIGAYNHDRCNSIQSLCPTCRLFGKIKGDELHCQGRVVFSDACLKTRDKLKQEWRFLKELSTPKPKHIATYSLDPNFRGKKTIAGRKFYYHHGENPHFWVEEHESNGRSIAIEEYALPHAIFSFDVNLEYVKLDELKRLLLAIELTEELGHKIGLGKSIGLGSCQIKVQREKSLLYWSTARYQPENKQQAALDWSELAQDVQKLPPALVEVLRLNKFEEGEIGYPNWKDNDEVKDDLTTSTVQPMDAENSFGHSNEQISDHRMRNRTRLTMKIDDLQRQWELLNEKLSGLNKQHILETRSEEKFRLEKLIDDTKTQCDQVEEQLKDMESQFVKVGGDAKEGTGRNDDQDLSPQGDPPEEKPEHIAVWLKYQHDNQLTFVDKKGKEFTRKLSDFQGKRNLLNNGDWYFLKGTRSIVFVKKK